MRQLLDAAAVRGLLQDQRWSINGLSRQMDSEAAGSAAWLQGRHQPSMESLDRLARALEVDPAPDEVLVMRSKTPATRQGLPHPASGLQPDRAGAVPSLSSVFAQVAGGVGLPKPRGGAPSMLLEQDHP